MIYYRLDAYAYDTTGRVTWIQTKATAAVFTWTQLTTSSATYDPDGRVMGEYGASATDVKAEFVWALPEVANDNAVFGGDDGVGGYAPVAVATPDAGGAIVLNWVHGNHMGVPLVTTDSAGNPATTPNDYLAPGFPGQSRVLADLYYNRYRDFDPSTGRYIQADPIGLDGGNNSYAYVGNNPINRIDPKGLNALALGLGLGELGGGAGLAAFCLEPVGWVVCGGAAIGGIGYGGYKLYKWWNPDCPPVLANEGGPYAGGTPDDRPEDFEPLGRPGRKSPPKRKRDDGSVWEGDRDQHGGSKWKRWPS